MANRGLTMDDVITARGIEALPDVIVQTEIMRSVNHGQNKYFLDMLRLNLNPFGDTLVSSNETQEQ